MKLTASQILAMAKKEMSILLVGVIQLCGGMMSNVVQSNVMLNGINTQLDKLDGIKSGTEKIRENIISLTERINELETAKTQMADLDLPRKLEQLGQRFSESIREINNSQIYQQRFMEEMDARSRRNNLIILGVPEESEESPLGLTDRHRVLKVIQKTEGNVSLHMDDLSVRRLGSNTSRSRPLLVTLGSHETCKEIVMNAKKLKDASDCASIFIRKDTHPTLRYEANRMRIRERNERANPENSNANIQYDRRKRVLMRNGIIIDRFRPLFQ